MITCFVILVQLDLYAALFREPTFGTPIKTLTAHINQCQVLFLSMPVVFTYSDTDEQFESTNGHA